MRAHHPPPASSRTWRASVVDRPATVDVHRSDARLGLRWERPSARGMRGRRRGRQSRRRGRSGCGLRADRARQQWRFIIYKPAPAVVVGLSPHTVGNEPHGVLRQTRVAYVPALLTAYGGKGQACPKILAPLNIGGKPLVPAISAVMSFRLMKVARMPLPGTRS